MRSYEDVECEVPGNSTKRPTVGNDTGTATCPQGTGAGAEGSVELTDPQVPRQRQGEDTHHMTDRRRRRAAPPESPESPGSPGADGRTGSAPDPDNPFAAPPKGRPDQPWQPRHHAGGDSGGTGGKNGPDDSEGQDGPHESGKKRWGSQWSSRQPGRQGGGFGKPRGSGEDGEGPGPGGPGRLRWDPADPAQRRARYALHSGIWGLFFALFSLPQIGLLLGSLALYWGISSMTAKNRVASSGGAASGGGTKATAGDVAGGGEGSRHQDGPSAGARPDVSPAQAAKAQASAAIGGLVTGVLALVVVASTFTFQMVYEDYFTCERDALTQSSREDCKRHLPEELRPFLEQSEPSAGS